MQCKNCKVKLDVNGDFFEVVKIVSGIGEDSDFFCSKKCMKED